MNGYNLLLFLHILAAMTWVGGGLMLGAAGLRLRGSSADSATFARVLPFVGIRLFMPANVLVLVTGLWMVIADSEWNFGQVWVLIGIGLFVVAFAIGGIYLSRLGIAMDRAAGTAAAELPGLVQRWLVAYGVVIVVLLGIVADMVFKPGTS